MSNSPGPPSGAAPKPLVRESGPRAAPAPKGAAPGARAINRLFRFVAPANRTPVTPGSGRKPGGAGRDRTGDLKLAKLPLSQLSYGPDQVEPDAPPRAPDAAALRRAAWRTPMRRRPSWAGNRGPQWWAAMVGLGRLELPTSRLSSARSNQLSYRPRDGMQDPPPTPPRRPLLGGAAHRGAGGRSTNRKGCGGSGALRRVSARRPGACCGAAVLPEVLQGRERRPKASLERR